MNLREFIDNKCFNNENDVTAIKVVWVNGGSGQNVKMVSLRHF